MDQELQKQKIELEIQEKELEAREFVQSYGPFQRYLFIVVVILIIPAFFIAKYGTSALYYSNFLKTAATAHTAAFVTLPAEIVDSKIIPITGNSYSAYALVKNQNKDLVSSALKYDFKFYDAAGNLLGNQQGTDFILAGQLKYLIVPNIVLAKAPVKVVVDLPNQTWQKRIDIPNVVFSQPIPVHADSQSPAGFTVDGTFMNQSNFTLGSVVVKAIVHDKSDKVIAVTQRLENTVGPQQLRGYHLYWPQFFENSLGRVEINIETNPFDQNNLQ